MPPINRPLRLILLAVLALLAAALLWLVLGVLHSAITLWQDLRALPGWAQAIVAVLLVAALCGLDALSEFCTCLVAVNCDLESKFFFSLHAAHDAAAEHRA